MSTTQKRIGRRAATALKFGVAGLAVLGLGGAVTAAAWTDTISFEAPAQAAQFDVAISYAGSGSWIGLHTGQTSVTLPAEWFAQLRSGETRTKTIEIKNFGTLDADIDIAASLTGDLASVGGAQVSVSKQSLVLGAPQGYTTFTVSITAPDWTPGQGGYAGNLSISLVANPVPAGS